LGGKDLWLRGTAADTNFAALRVFAAIAATPLALGPGRPTARGAAFSLSEESPVAPHLTAHSIRTNEKGKGSEEALAA